VGGTEVRTCRIINFLRQQYRHVIISCRGGFAAKRLLDESLEVEYVDASPLFSGSRLRAFYNIARTLRQQGPDLLIAYEWGAIDWVMVNSILRVCPTIMTLEGFEESELSGEKAKRRLIRRTFYRRCERVVACSKVLCRLAEESWRVSEPGQVVHIPNGVDCARYAAEVRGRSAPGRATMLGAVASLIKLKNHRKLVRCVATVAARRPVVLYVVGEGPERENLMAYCRELMIEDRVHFTGHLEDPSTVLRDLDVFCLTSDTEQMPMVILEAMAAGLPVVSTDVGDVREMVATENQRFVLARDDEEGYVQALTELCEQPLLRQATGQANRRKCLEDYEEQLMLQRYGDLYESVLRPSRE
jgi:glycosyltransferase involved in cell wall biosynthesis